MSSDDQIVARSDLGTAFYLFGHQAGGHKPFLRSAHGDVCKPAIPLELQFYQALDTRFPQLKPFVPPFVGVITVDLHPPEDGSAESPGGKKRRLDAGPTRSFISTTSYSAKLWKKERSHSSENAVVTPKPRSAREYLVLGDLTRAYARPCVLDIKMGTRQHGEDATPAKAASHTAKCAATTSLALGLRICGMQVYDDVAQRYVLWDKHWGRQLTRDDIQPALTAYLSNARGVHRDALQSLRDQLHALERVVAATTGVRFWGASLLLIYEGDRSVNAPREDVHLIDFAHCQMSDALATPDDGLLLGLANLVTFLTRILETS